MVKYYWRSTTVEGKTHVQFIEKMQLMGCSNELELGSDNCILLNGPRIQLDHYNKNQMHNPGVPIAFEEILITGDHIPVGARIQLPSHVEHT